ncbi:hypothetical protein N7528_006844 [Penicillium herquei]|nr:hypothetical protein N7528_006844 [Penicillium herquei]
MFKVHTLMGFTFTDIQLKTITPVVTPPTVPKLTQITGYSNLSGGLELQRSGKTKTAVSNILAHACIGNKELLCAPSNKTVEDLAGSVFEVLESDKEIRQRAANTVCFQTPSSFISVVRQKSVKTDPIWQVELYGKKYKNPFKAVRFSFVVKVCANGPKRSETLMLKMSAERIMATVLERATKNIAEVTLRSTAQELLFLTFRPDAVICDESGWCFEGEQVIAMSFSSGKAVFLMGDPDQFPPTVISTDQTNELSQYLQRPLIPRP